MAETAILLLAPLALLSTKPAPAGDLPVLDTIFAFDDSANCVPTKNFREILDKLAVPKPDGRWHAGNLVLPKGYENVLAYFNADDTKRPLVPMIFELVGNNGRHDVIANIRGNWHGLSLESIRVWAGPPNGKKLVEFGFYDDAGHVAAVLSDLGFATDPSEPKLACALS
jgi:hypothetical protein